MEAYKSTFQATRSNIDSRAFATNSSESQLPSYVCQAYEYVENHGSHVGRLDSHVMKGSIIVLTALSVMTSSSASSPPVRRLVNSAADPYMEHLPCCADMPSISALGQLSKPYISGPRVGGYVAPFSSAIGAEFFAFIFLSAKMLCTMETNWLRLGLQRQRRCCLLEAC